MGLLDWVWPRKGLQPGMKCSRSGQWSWSQFPHDQVTSNKGDPMPPPPRINRDQEGGYWELTDKTRTQHKR